MQQGLDEAHYDHVRDAHAHDDGELFERLRAVYSDTEILELVTTCGFCVGRGLRRPPD